MKEKKSSRIYKPVTSCVVLLLMILGVCINKGSYDDAFHHTKELKSEFSQIFQNYTIQLADGIRENKELIILGEGAPQSIGGVTESKGGVKLSDYSNLSVGKSSYVASMLHFTNGYKLTQAVMAFRVNKNKISDNWKSFRIVMNNYSDSEYYENSSLISLQGMKNRFDLNVFNNKENRGVMMFECFDGKESNHQINHNYFGLGAHLDVNVGENSIKC